MDSNDMTDPVCGEEAVARAIWDTWRKSDVAQEWGRDFTFEELRELSYTATSAEIVFVTLINETRAAIRAHTAALREAGLLREWRPIESAPKDGSEIVALSRGARWIVSWREFTLGGPLDGGWQIKALPGRDPIAYIKPTHWMLLPAAPPYPPDTEGK